MAKFPVRELKGNNGSKKRQHVLITRPTPSFIHFGIKNAKNDYPSYWLMHGSPCRVSSGSKHCLLLTGGTSTWAQSCRVKSTRLIPLPWLLCHLQLVGDKWLFMTLSSSSLSSDPWCTDTAVHSLEGCLAPPLGCKEICHTHSFQHCRGKRRATSHFLQLWNNPNTLVL